MFDRLKGMALIMYNNTDFAQAAVRETKGWKIGGNKIKVKDVNDVNIICCLVKCPFSRVLMNVCLFMIGGLCKSRESDGVLPIYAGIWSRH